jgi:hypothetical protein
VAARQGGGKGLFMQGVRAVFKNPKGLAMGGDPPRKPHSARFSPYLSIGKYLKPATLKKNAEVAFGYSYFIAIVVFQRSFGGARSREFGLPQWRL